MIRFTYCGSEKRVWFPSSNKLADARKEVATSETSEKGGC